MARGGQVVVYAGWTLFVVLPGSQTELGLVEPGEYIFIEDKGGDA